jgi:ankyrin repeat protein
MRTRQTFSVVGSVILSLFFMTVIFTPYLAAGDEEAEAEARSRRLNPVFLKSAWEGKAEIVQLFLRTGVDVNAKNDKNGLTALMAAAIKGHTDIIRILLQAGADLNVQDNRG